MVDDKIKYLNQDELNRLFKAIEKEKERHWLRNLCMFRVAYRCALRASEISLIKLQDYNRVKSEIYCKRLKNSWNNTLRLDDTTTKLLDKYIRQYQISGADEIIFKSQEKNPISRKTLDYLMKKFCSKARIEDKSKHHFHALKHSAAVHYGETLDIKELNFILGHRNIANSMVYYRFTTTQQDAMYKKLAKSKALV